MKLFTLDLFRSYIDNSVVSALHANFFHGGAERDGRRFPHDIPVWANTPSPSPLILTHTKHVPAVFQPSTHLVLSADVAERFVRIPNTKLLPVVFRHLVNVSVRKGDWFWDPTWGSIDSGELLYALPDDPDLHASVGDYYELLVWRWQDFIIGYPEANLSSLDIAVQDYREHASFKISLEAMESFPIFWVHGMMACTEGVYDLLDDVLDRDFFNVKSYKL